MRKLKTGLLALLLTAGACLFSGCDQVDETLLDNSADFSVNISVPYSTTAPHHNQQSESNQVVIDANGGVTVNDPYLLGGSHTVQQDDGQYDTLSLGDTGPEVQTLQNRLQALGYFTSGASGVFDEPTKTAVKRFEQSYGIMQTGIATPAFQSRLFAQDAPVYGSEAYDTAVVSQYSTLQRGAVGSSVYALQHRLKELGYPIKDLSGVYDENTENAVRLFAEAYGVDNLTVAYIALQKELYSDTALTYSDDGDRPVTGISILNIGNAGTRVMQIQNQLIKLGYMNGSPSGVYDTETADAVRLFEEACGVMPSGQLNTELLNILMSGNAPIFGTRYQTEIRTYSDLAEGSSGEQITQLQQRLIALGYAAGAANGIYGSETSTAVRMFQRYNGLEETGAASIAVQERIFSPGALSYADIQSGLTFATPTPEPTQRPAGSMTLALDLAAETAAETEIEPLGRGSSGEAVQKLQERLNKLGYKCSTDGDYDESTEDAMKAFQKNVGVKRTGKANASMQQYIYTNAAPAKKYRMHKSTQTFETLKMGDSGEEVSNLQEKLWELGYLLTDDVQNSVGVFHDKTREAVVSAQLAMGYETPDGIATPEFQCFVFSEYNYFIKK